MSSLQTKYIWWRPSWNMSAIKEWCCGRRWTSLSSHMNRSVLRWLRNRRKRGRECRRWAWRIAKWGRTWLASGLNLRKSCLQVVIWCTLIKAVETQRPNTRSAPVRMGALQCHWKRKQTRVNKRLNTRDLSYHVDLTQVHRRENTRKSSPKRWWCDQYRSRTNPSALLTKTLSSTCWTLHASTRESKPENRE